MKRYYNFHVTLFAIIISVMLIDGGKSFIHDGTNNHFSIIHKHNHDEEAPGQESFRIPVDQENLIVSENWVFILPSFISENIIYLKDFKSFDFSASVWQPPKTA
jgi:hypothetical protein